MSKQSKRALVDEKSFKLAEFFLSDVVGANEDDKWSLAEEIQDVCEASCRDVEKRERAGEAE